MATGGPTVLCVERFPTMPTPRTFCRAFSKGDVVYIAGGCDKNGVALGALESVDLSKKKPKWTRHSDMPTRRAGCSGAFVDETLVVFGGIDETRKPHDSVNAYDLKTKTWSTLDSFAEPMNGTATFVRDSRLYAIGGNKENGNPSDAFHALELARNMWISLAPLQTSRYATTAHVLDDCVYAIGGRFGKMPSVAAEFYDFRSPRWEKLPDLPSKCVFVGSAADVDGKRLYFVGGLHQPATKGFANDFNVFDIRANQWDSLSPLPQKKGDLVCEWMGDQLLVVGGMGAESPEAVPTVHGQIHAYDPARDSWAEIGTLGTPRSAMASALIPSRPNQSQQKAFIVGGLGRGGPSNAADVLKF